MAVLTAGVCTAATSDTNKKNTTTTVFSADIDCDHCAQKIMNNVPLLGKGVKDVTVDVPAKEVTVVYDGEKTNIKTLVAGFAKMKVTVLPKQADVKAQKTKANLDATQK